MGLNPVDDIEQAILGEIKAAVADGKDVYLMSGSTSVAASRTASWAGTSAPSRVASSRCASASSNGQWMNCGPMPRRLL